MKENGLIFAIGFILAFAGGYFFFTGGDSAETDTAVSTTATEESATSEDQAEEKDTPSDEQETASVEAEALSNNNCLSCHAVESLGVEGGTTGPDLSHAFRDVEGKHGKPIEEFLQEPTSAVMSSVIGENPLPDEEREQIIKILEKAAEQN